MIYPPDYFDDCNGLIPQIVLCVMVLQAGNEKTRIQRNGLLKDVTDSAVWGLSVGDDGIGYLSLQGYLPVMESRYLLSQDSFVERVGATNSYNVGLVSNAVGLPFGAFATGSLNPVVLPPLIDRLTVAPLVIETRLAWLLFQLEKRNNLYKLYNFCRYAYAISIGIPLAINPGTGYGTATPIAGAPVVFMKVINFIFNKLFTAYPQLEKMIFGSLGGSATSVNKLEDVSAWLELQLNSIKMPYIPAIDPREFIDSLESEITEIKEYKITDPPGSSFLVQIASNDVSSEISASATNSSNTEVQPPFNFAPENSTNDTSISGGSGGGGDSDPESPKDEAPVNSLPEC